MNPIDKKLREILETYKNREVNRRYDENEEILGLDEQQSLDLALAEIKKVWGEMVGEDKQPHQNTAGRVIGLTRYGQGYNRAKAELRQKVGEK